MSLYLFARATLCVCVRVWPWPIGSEIVNKHRFKEHWDVWQRMAIEIDFGMESATASHTHTHRYITTEFATFLLPQYVSLMVFSISFLFSSLCSSFSRPSPSTRCSFQCLFGRNIETKRTKKIMTFLLSHSFFFSFLLLSRLSNNYWSESKY